MKDDSKLIPCLTQKNNFQEDNFSVSNKIYLSEREAVSCHGDRRDSKGRKTWENGGSAIFYAITSDWGNKWVTQRAEKKEQKSLPMGISV